MGDPKKVLIIGGTSGLGLEIANLHKTEGWEVHTTGVRAGHDYGERIHRLNLAGEGYAINLAKLVMKVGPIDRLVWSVGLYEPKNPRDTFTDEIQRTVKINFTALPVLLSNILRNQTELECLCVITSSTARSARLEEAVYAASKAAQSTYIKTVASDECIHQVLEVAPGMMRAVAGKDVLGYPEVAEEVFELLGKMEPYLAWSIIVDDGDVLVRKI